MNYSQFGIAKSPEDVQEVEQLAQQNELKALRKALTLERLGKGY